MKCKQVNRNMLSFLDGNLGQAIQKSMQEHISACTECQKAFSQVKDVYQTIDSEKKDFKTNPFFTQKVLDRISTGSAKPAGIIIPIRRMAIASIAAAGIVFGIGIGTLLNDTFTSSSPNGSEQVWTQLADDYFPADVFSPYEELNGND